MYLCTQIRILTVLEEKEMTLLGKIKYSADLRLLAEEQLPGVCDELRRDIVDDLSVSPGHLASRLGVVELIVALHYV